MTCSLDKTIKVWDIKQPADHTQHQPTLTINTTYPIWRARDLPFGHGVLSLPQRGETALEMYSPNDPFEPVEKFEGHADVVKEFVWRKGGRCILLSSLDISWLKLCIRKGRVPTHYLVERQNSSVLAH